MSGKNNRPLFTRMAALLSASLLAFSCTDELLDTSGPVGLSGVGSDSICFGVSSSDAMTKASGSGPGRILGTDSFILRSKDSSDTLCVTATITEGIDLPLPGEEMPLTRRSLRLTPTEAFMFRHILQAKVKEARLTAVSLWMTM